MQENLNPEFDTGIQALYQWAARAGYSLQIVQPKILDPATSQFVEGPIQVTVMRQAQHEIPANRWGTAGALVEICDVLGAPPIVTEDAVTGMPPPEPPPPRDALVLMEVEKVRKPLLGKPAVLCFVCPGECSENTDDREPTVTWEGPREETPLECPGCGISIGAHLDNLLGVGVDAE